MKNYLLPVLLLLSILSINSYARKPAVEPVSGIEPESYNTTSTGVEVQFNFGNHIYATTPQSSELASDSSGWVAGFVLLSFVLLPFGMWFAINRESIESAVATTTNTTDHKTYADTISQDNVESLSAHRKDQNKKDDTKKAA